MSRRQFRSDARVDTVEDYLGIGNSLTNPDGRNARSDKHLGTLRDDWDNWLSGDKDDDDT